MMLSNIKYGEGRCEAHGRTWALINGAGGCPECAAKNMCPDCDGRGIERNISKSWGSVLPVKTCGICGVTSDPLEVHQCKPCRTCSGTGKLKVKENIEEVKPPDLDTSNPYRDAIIKTAKELFDFGEHHFNFDRIFDLASNDLGIRDDNEKLCMLLTEFHSMFNDDVFSPGSGRYNCYLPHMHLTPRGMKELDKMSMSPIKEDTSTKFGWS